jgi:hypothetical protein
MLVVSNRSYLSAWCADLPESKIVERFGAFLATVPFSQAQRGFTHITVRAVHASQPPIYEADARSAPFDLSGVLEVIERHVNSDSAYEVRTHGDLSLFDAPSVKWKVEPQPLEIACFGEDYDEGVWGENGHFRVDLGFEHLFTGHAHLLGAGRSPSLAESAEEARFLEAMAWPENRERYQRETRKNIKHLFDWVGRIQRETAVQRVQLWSEGEENFEARLEEISAVQ